MSKEPRYEVPLPSELVTSQRALRRSILGGRRGQRSAFALEDADGRLTGPFGLMLLAPDLGSHLEALGAAVRFESTPSHREREIVILTVARLTMCAFERYAHERVGSSVGLTGEEIEALHSGTFTSTDVREQCAHDLTELLFLNNGHASAEEFDLIVRAIDASEVYELVVTAGYYLTLAWTLNLFDVGTPDPRQSDTPGIR